MSLSADARRIWEAGIAAVRADRLTAQAVRVDGDRLTIAGEPLPQGPYRSLTVVGAGKAGAGMALGIERALGETFPADRRTGWINVPDDCLQPTAWIHLHPGRPAGVNSPTEAGVAGTRQILRLVERLGPDDLCIVLLSGGGSALLPAPRPGITLADKQAVTRLLSERGASIDELNLVRRQLSEVKGGGLLRACGAGTVIVLVISDVVGDPLETIASGPTIPSPTTAADALAVLRRFAPDRADVPDRVWNVLETQRHRQGAARASDSAPVGPRRCVRHYIIGNNLTACTSAAQCATELGYTSAGIRAGERGVAREVGAALAAEGLKLRGRAVVDRERFCLITGGEPVVHLAAGDHPRRGGRNQELVLAATEHLWDEGAVGLCLLSGGTDGEDGPTDAAGAWLDADVIQRARQLGLHPAEFLRWNNSYPFFDAAGGLLKTGPTHTNVMDLRVLLVEPAAETGA